MRDRRCSSASCASSRRPSARAGGRALNVHPSLLPAFAGGMDLEVHKAAVAAKATRERVHRPPRRGGSRRRRHRRAEGVLPVYRRTRPRASRRACSRSRAPRCARPLPRGGDLARDTPCAGDKRKAVDVSETHPYPLPIGEAAEPSRSRTRRPASTSTPATRSSTTSSRSPRRPRASARWARSAVSAASST